MTYDPTRPTKGQPPKVRILQDTDTVRVQLVDADGRTAEVTVAAVGTGLVVIAAGDVVADFDYHQNRRLRVEPTADPITPG